jgi:hypothetical protein
MDRVTISIFPYHGARASSEPGPHHCRGFSITLGRTPLGEWSARRRDLYLTKHNTHKRQTFMPPAGLKPAIPASERPQTHTLDFAATGIGAISNYHFSNLILFSQRTMRARTNDLKLGGLFTYTYYLDRKRLQSFQTMYMITVSPEPSVTVLCFSIFKYLQLHFSRVKQCRFCTI